MIPDQIRQIAEEYAASMIDPMPIGNYLPEIFTISKESAKKSFAEMYTPFLEWLTERYCVVERSKVVEEYNKTKVLYEGRSDVSIYMQNAIYRIFGSETFNKK